MILGWEDLFFNPEALMAPVAAPAAAPNPWKTTVEPAKPVNISLTPQPPQANSPIVQPTSWAALNSEPVLSPRVPLSPPPQAEYDAFKAFGKSPASAPAQSKPGLLGQSFGIMAPDEQQQWLADQFKAHEEGLLRIDNIKKMIASNPSPTARRALQAQLAAQEGGLPNLDALNAMKEGRAPLPIKTGLRAAVENAPRGFADAVLGIPEFVGIVKGYLSDHDVDDDSLVKWSLGAKDYVKGLFPGDVARQNEFSQQLAGGLGQIAAFYGGGAAAALLKAGPKAVAAVTSMMGASATGSAGFEEATKELKDAQQRAKMMGDEATAGELDRILKTFGYAAVGTTEAIPIAKTFSRAIPETLGARVAQGVEGAAEEALQEGGSQLAQNLITQQTTDPNRPTMEGVAEGAAVGAVLGGGMGAAFPGRAGRAAEPGIEQVDPFLEPPEIKAGEPLSFIDLMPGEGYTEVAKTPAVAAPPRALPAPEMTMEGADAAARPPADQTLDDADAAARPVRARLDPALTAQMPEAQRYNERGFELRLPYYERWGNPRFQPEDRQRALTRIAEIGKLDPKTAPWADLVAARDDLQEIGAQLLYYGPEVTPEQVDQFADEVWHYGYEKMDPVHAARARPSLFKTPNLQPEVAEIVEAMRPVLDRLYATKRAGLSDLLYHAHTEEPKTRKRAGPAPERIGEARGGFYFKAGRELANVPDALFQQGGQAVIDYLTQAGVKKAEIKHLGLDALANKKSVTREEVAQAIAERQFEFRRKTSWFNPESNQMNYDLGKTRAFAGPRIPGRGIYFERLMAFPKKLKGGEDFAPGHFVSPHWESELPGTWASWRGSIREVPGWGTMVVGEEGQSDLMQGAVTGRRPRVKGEEFIKEQQAGPQKSTPETPIDDSYVRTMVRDLLLQAAAKKADSVAISTSETTARIQNKTKAAHFYDTQLKTALERELRRITGDGQLSLEKVALPKPMGGKKEKPYTVWATQLSPEAVAKINSAGQPLFAKKPAEKPAQKAQQPLPEQPYKAVGKPAEGTARQVELSAQLTKDQAVTQGKILLDAGRTVRVPTELQNAAMGAIERVRAQIPANVNAGALSRIEPAGFNASGKPLVRAVFTFDGGGEQGFQTTWKSLTELRAIYLDRPDGSGVILLPLLDPAESSADYLGSVLRHEIVHALRRQGNIPGGDFNRLLGHAMDLRVLDMEYAAFAEATKDPYVADYADGVTIRQFYAELYKGKPDFDERMAQEAVAHMIELVAHGALTAEQMAPVQDVLSNMESGAYREPATAAIPQRPAGAGDAAAKPGKENIHPKPDENGQPVKIKKPSQPTPPDTWDNPNALATFVPGGETLGVTWEDVPETPQGWDTYTSETSGLDLWSEPAWTPTNKKVGAGVVLLTADGRFVLTAPTNAFGGYQATFPKGNHDPNMSMQSTAAKEAWEETGLMVRITGFVGDFERTTSKARYYLAEVIGGTPDDMGWESQAVHFAPAADAMTLLNNKVDRDILEAALIAHGTKAAKKPKPAKVKKATIADVVKYVADGPAESTIQTILDMEEEAGDTQLTPAGLASALEEMFDDPEVMGIDPEDDPEQMQILGHVIAALKGEAPLPGKAAEGWEESVEESAGGDIFAALDKAPKVAADFAVEILKDLRKVWKQNYPWAGWSGLSSTKEFRKAFKAELKKEAGRLDKSDKVLLAGLFTIVQDIDVEAGPAINELPGAPKKTEPAQTATPDAQVIKALIGAKNAPQELTDAIAEAASTATKAGGAVLDHFKFAVNEANHKADPSKDFIGWAKALQTSLMFSQGDVQLAKQSEQLGAMVVAIMNGLAAAPVPAKKAGPKPAVEWTDAEIDALTDKDFASAKYLNPATALQDYPGSTASHDTLQWIVQEAAKVAKAKGQPGYKKEFLKQVIQQAKDLQKLSGGAVKEAAESFLQLAQNMLPGSSEPSPTTPQPLSLAAAKLVAKNMGEDVTAELEKAIAANKYPNAVEHLKLEGIAQQLGAVALTGPYNTEITEKIKKLVQGLFAGADNLKKSGASAYAPPAAQKAPKYTIDDALLEAGDEEAGTVLAQLFDTLAQNTEGGVVLPGDLAEAIEDALENFQGEEEDTAPLLQEIADKLFGKTPPADSLQKKTIAAILAKPSTKLYPTAAAVLNAGIPPSYSTAKNIISETATNLYQNVPAFKQAGPYPAVAGTAEFKAALIDQLKKTINDNIAQGNDTTAENIAAFIAALDPATRTQEAPKPPAPPKGLTFDDLIPAPQKKFTFARNAGGGSKPKEIWQDEDGNEYMFKPVPKDAQFLAYGEAAGGHISRLINPLAPRIWVQELNGRLGSMQEMLPNSGTLRGTDVADLTLDEAQAIQREHVVDWLISNHDGHDNQFLILEGGKIAGIDKGQAFKYFGKDRLAIDYHPNSVYGEKEPIYNTFWRAYSKGQLSQVKKTLEADYVDDLAKLDEKLAPLEKYVGELVEQVNKKAAEFTKFDNELPAKSSELTSNPDLVPDLTDAVQGLEDGFLEQVRKAAQLKEGEYWAVKKQTDRGAFFISRSGDYVTAGEHNPELQKVRGVPLNKGISVEDAQKFLGVDDLDNGRMLVVSIWPTRAGPLTTALVNAGYDHVTLHPDWADGRGGAIALTTAQPENITPWKDELDPLVKEHYGDVMQASQTYISQALQTLAKQFLKGGALKKVLSDAQDIEDLEPYHYGMSSFEYTNEYNQGRNPLAAVMSHWAYNTNYFLDRRYKDLINGEMDIKGWEKLWPNVLDNTGHLLTTHVPQYFTDMRDNHAPEGEVTKRGLEKLYALRNVKRHELNSLRREREELSQRGQEIMFRAPNEAIAALQQNLSTPDFLSILRPYAQGRWPKNPSAVDAFLDYARQRKENLGAKFHRFFVELDDVRRRGAKALKEDESATGDTYRSHAAHFNKHNNTNLTPDEYSAIHNYTNSAFSRLNRNLRKDTPVEADRMTVSKDWLRSMEYAALLEAALEKLPPYKGEVYRGQDLTQEELNQIYPGRVLHTKSFFSTSRTGGFSGKVRFVIQSLTGRNVEDLSGHPSEREVLFAPDRNFLVQYIDPEGDYKGNPVIEIHVTELPEVDFNDLR